MMISHNKKKHKNNENIDNVIENEHNDIYNNHSNDDEQQKHFTTENLTKNLKNIEISRDERDFNSFEEPDIIDDTIKIDEPAAGMMTNRPTTLERPNQNFHYNKMHMGLKNISFNVGSIVSPTNKMEFYKGKSEIFGGVNKIQQAAGQNPSKLFPDNSDAVSTTSSGGSDRSHLTEQGFFDLKFYHNKLW